MNRHLVRAAVVTQLRAAASLSGVQIELIWPGDQTEAEAIYLLPSQGVLDIPTYRGQPSASNPLRYEDRFTVPLEIKAAVANQTDTDADARIEALVEACISVFAVDAQLGLGDPPNSAGLMWATVGEYDGPGPARGSEGAQAYARLTLHCCSRSI